MSKHDDSMYPAAKRKGYVNVRLADGTLAKGEDGKPLELLLNEAMHMFARRVFDCPPYADLSMRFEVGQPPQITVTEPTATESGATKAAGESPAPLE